MCEFMAREDPMRPEVLRGMRELLDGRDNNGRTPLHLACQQGHLDVVRILISYGASLELIDNEGRTPLDLAAGHEPVLEYLASLDVRLE
jgi:ankyrin repeat protein